MVTHVREKQNGALAYLDFLKSLKTEQNQDTETLKWASLKNVATTLREPIPGARLVPGNAPLNGWVLYIAEGWL